MNRMSLVKRLIVITIFITNSVYAEKIIFESMMQANKFVNDYSGLLGNAKNTIDLINEETKIKNLKKISFEVQKAIQHNKGVKKILEGYGGKKIDKLMKHIDDIDSNIQKLTRTRTNNNNKLFRLARTKGTVPTSVTKVLKVADKLGKAAYVVDMAAKTGVIVAQYKEGTLSVKETLNFALDGANIIDKFGLIQGARYIEKTFENILDKKRVINNYFLKDLDLISEHIEYFSSKEIVFTRLNGSHKGKLLKIENLDDLLAVIKSIKRENIRILEQQDKDLTNLQKSIEQSDSHLFAFKLDVDEALHRSFLFRIKILGETIRSKIKHMKNEDPLIYSEKAVFILAANNIEQIKPNILKIDDTLNKQIMISDRILKAIRKHKSDATVKTKITKNPVNKKYVKEVTVKQPLDTSRLTLRECNEKTINKKFQTNKWTTSFDDWNRVHIACLKLFYQTQAGTVSNKRSIQNTNKTSLYYLRTHPYEKLASIDCNVRVFGQTVSLIYRGGQLITPEYKLRGWGDVSNALRYDLAPADNIMKSINACNRLRQMLTYGNLSTQRAVEIIVRGYTRESSPFSNAWDPTAKNIPSYSIQDIQRAQNKYNTSPNKHVTVRELSLEQCKVKYRNYGNAQWARAQGAGTDRGKATACYQAIVAAPMMGMNGQLFIDQYNRGTYNW